LEDEEATRRKEERVKMGAVKKARKRKQEVEAAKKKKELKQLLGTEGKRREKEGKRREQEAERNVYLIQYLLQPPRVLPRWLLGTISPPPQL
jgi:hypothetical protein